jgi:hypothetical protein
MVLDGRGGTMKSRGRALLALITFLGAAAALLSVQTSGAGGDGATIRWDITTVTAGPTISPGGSGSALATEALPLKITLTGSGTFDPGDDDEVTGGGTWTTFDEDGQQTGSGTYQVTELVAWHEAPGSLPPAANDTIGRAADARAGLAVLQIRYSDGSGLGKLVVSCHLPVGSPDSIFEGITASKGFVDYFRPVAPSTTIFHVLREDEEGEDGDNGRVDDTERDDRDDDGPTEHDDLDEE